MKIYLICLTIMVSVVALMDDTENASLMFGVGIIIFLVMLPKFKEFKP